MATLERFVLSYIPPEDPPGEEITWVHKVLDSARVVDESPGHILIEANRQTVQDIEQKLKRWTVAKEHFASSDARFTGATKINKAGGKRGR